MTSQVLQNLRFCTHSFALQNRRFCTQPVTKASLLLQTPCTASPCKSKICTQAERLRAAPLRLHSFALQNPPRSGVGFVRSQAQPTAVQLPAQQSCATAANRRFASKQPFDLQATAERSCARPRSKTRAILYKTVGFVYPELKLF